MRVTGGGGGNEKLILYLEKSWHVGKVTVWAVLRSTGVIEPFFENKDGNTQTMNSIHCLEILKKKNSSDFNQILNLVSTGWGTPHTPRIVAD